MRNFKNLDMRAKEGTDDYFEYDKKSASELDWFYHLTGGLTHTDFFAS